MEPRETPSNRPSASLKRAPWRTTGRQPGAPMPDPLERLGLVFFAAALLPLLRGAGRLGDSAVAGAAVPVYEVTAVALDAAYETDAQAAKSGMAPGR